MHTNTLYLSPRYTLDDDLAWLVGIDPVRRYWLRVNGDASETVSIPGLAVSSPQAFKKAILGFRSLSAGESLFLPTSSNTRLEICCVGENLYAIPHLVQGAPAWHLFDYETIESFLMTAHPDWQCSPKDMELGRALLQQSWGQPSLA